MTLRSALGDAWRARTPARVAALLAVAYVVTVGLLLVARLEATWGEVDQRGVVQEQVPTGQGRDCGRACTCDEVAVDLALEDGGTGRLLACADRYARGDSVVVRRRRDGTANGTATGNVELAPPPLGEALAVAMALPLVATLAVAARVGAGRRWRARRA